MPPLLWSHRLRGAACGLALARESGHVLAWDSNHWLVLLNRRGEVQGQAQFGAGIVAGAVAADGSAVAVADDRGQVSWLARDLAQRWCRPLPHQPTALAVEPLGRGLVAAGAGSRLHFFDAGGPPARALAVRAVGSAPARHLRLRTGGRPGTAGGALAVARLPGHPPWLSGRQ